jgi:glycosyltransferase involved in cell wall biosynthesis
MLFLPKTLNSVFSQTFQDYEIIIINDGSTDEIVEWFNENTDPRIKLISQENKGQSAARNLGIISSKGEYIAFLDSDDIWEKNKLERQNQVLDENPQTGLVYSRAALIDTKDNFLKSFRQDCLDENVWVNLLQSNIIISCSIPMVRRSCLENVGLFRTFSHPCEDWDMWLRLSAQYSFKFIEEILVYYRINPIGLTRSRPKESVAKLRKQEKTYKVILDQALNISTLDMEYVKERSYALAYIRVAWTALNSTHRNHKYADYCCNQAASYHSRIIFSSEYKKIKMIILIVDLLGFWSYLNYKKIKELSAIFIDRIKHKKFFKKKIIFEKNNLK